MTRASGRTSHRPQGGGERRLRASRVRPGGRRPHPEACRYRFVGGKGGVGKTTCAAAAGLVAAEAGRRVLVVSTDPAHSLGDVLATRLGPRATRVRTRRGQLYAAELDADRALERWMAARRPALRTIAERGTYLDEEDIERLLRLSLPGVDELIGLVELVRLARAGGYHDVVVDTAPTGHTLRLLTMPETLRRVAAVLDQMHAKHRFLASRLGGAHRLDASDALIEEIDAEGRALHALLRDGRRAAFTWVLLPEPLAIEEAADGLRELDASGIAVTDLVVNRVAPLPTEACAFCDARVRAERAALAAIRARFPGRPLRLLPALAREPRGLPALRFVGARLSAPPRTEVQGPATGRRVTARAAPRPDRRDTRGEWLDLIAPPGVRLVLFTGKGGAGKTTCATAAALAIAAEARDRKVLLLSTDPAHSIGDALGVALGDRVQSLPGAAPALRARELDADRAFRDRRRRYRAAVDQLFDTLRQSSRFDLAFDRAVLQDLIDLAPPGLDELFALLSITDALLPREGRPPAYDTVVVDTAPTGHTLRLLALPGTALEWVRALLAILLKYRRLTGLGDLAQDLVDASRSLRQLDALLREPQTTRVVVVTRAAEVPRLETARLLHELDALGIATAAVIVNAVTLPGPSRCGRCRRAAAREAREVEALRAVNAGGRTGPEVITAPAVAPPPRGVAGLDRWGRSWTRLSE